MKIINRLTDAVIFESTADTMRETVLAAIAAGTDLSDANLRGAYLRGANLSGTDLSGTDLHGANLSGTDLSGTDLHGANLSGTDLRGANLRGADLSGTDLHGAYLRGAYLSGTDLHGANLRGANLSGTDLSGTCLSPALHDYARAFAQRCKPVGRHGGRIVYRTYTSQHAGSYKYEIGKTHIANALSWDAATACHPGIYAYGTLAELRREFPSAQCVRCYVRDGDYTITAKDAIRCARIRVLSCVGSEVPAAMPAKEK